MPPKPAKSCLAPGSRNQNANDAAAANLPPTHVAGRPDPATMTERHRIASEQADAFLASVQREFREQREAEERQRSSSQQTSASPALTSAAPAASPFPTPEKLKAPKKNKKPKELGPIPKLFEDEPAPSPTPYANDPLEPDINKPIKRLVDSLSRNFPYMRRKREEKAARATKKAEAKEAEEKAKKEGEERAKVEARNDAKRAYLQRMYPGIDWQPWQPWPGPPGGQED